MSGTRREIAGDPGDLAGPVLVTGARGFIGQHLVAHLTAQGLPVRTITRQPVSFPAGVENFRADVRHNFSVLAEGCSCVVHLAGLADASSSGERAAEFAEVNVIGTIRALEAAHQAGAAFVLASSQRVYRPSIRPLAEDAAREPIDPYGLTKLQAEEWTELFTRIHGMRATILRFFSVYGPGQVSGTASGVVSIFLRRARSDEALRVRARQFRDFVDVRDAVRAIELAVRRPADGLRTFNVGSGIATSLSELGDLVRQVVGSTTPMILDMTPGAESYVADPRRSASELGFEPRIALKDGLVWYNQHLDRDTAVQADRSRDGR